MHIPTYGNNNNRNRNCKLTNNFVAIETAIIIIVIVIILCGEDKEVHAMTLFPIVDVRLFSLSIKYICASNQRILFRI